jgi:uncharacterized protein YndB with AHSA1/START domain
MNHQPLVIERTFNAPAARIWKALTDKEEMRQWYFDIKEFRPELGYEFQFTAGKEGKPYLHHCKITELIPGKKISYSWSYDGYRGISFVSFELFQEGGSTRLVLTHAGLESFPKDNPDFARECFAEGWTYIIGSSLKQFTESPQINVDKLHA